jgi:hypothetical protein
MDAFWDRPAIDELREIFGHPKPPKTIVEEQFDGDQLKLAELARKEWGAIRSADWYPYLDDLEYVTPLQGDLFDYLFPGLLAFWFGSLMGEFPAFGGPPDFYTAVDKGRVFETVVGSRRDKALQWMADRFIQAVDSKPRQHDPHYIYTFNALGQSIPIVDRLLAQMTGSSTVGRAWFWLWLVDGLVFGCGKSLLCSGSVYDDVWDPGIIVGADASIFSHGYLDCNLQAVRKRVTYEGIVEVLESAKALPWRDGGDTAVDLLLDAWQSNPDLMRERIALWIGALGMAPEAQRVFMRQLRNARNASANP